MMGEIISSKTWLPDLYIPLMGDSAYVGYWFMHILHSGGQSVCYSWILVEPLMSHSNILLDLPIPCDVLYAKASELCDNAIIGTP